MLTYELKTVGGKAFAAGMLAEKSFSTGNDGYWGGDKTALPKVTHLSNDPVVVTVKDGDDVVASFYASPRTFSTGSYGYWAGGKVFTAAGEVQAQAQLVLVGSKGIAKDGLKALNNKYQVQIQMVLLHGVKFGTAQDMNAQAEAAAAQ